MRRSFVLALAVLAAPFALAGQTTKIVVTGLSEEAVGELRAAAPGVNLVLSPRARLVQEVADADAILGTINPELIRAGRNLKWVQIYSAGVEGVLSPELVASDITLTNAKIIQGPQIADHAMAMLLALTRGLHVYIPRRTKGDWKRDLYEPVELHGKTAVVLGVGGIGMQIAVRAHAAGMKVIGVDPEDIPYTPFVSRVVRPDRLDEVLPEADVVFVAAPLTPASTGMMGPRQFDLMKQNSFFIAVSRGRLFNPDALMKALDSRRLAGAGLDVTNPEPLPPDHALWKFENVIITPHIAGQSDGIDGRRMALLKENIRRFAAGEPLLNVVDKQKGY